MAGKTFHLRADPDQAPRSGIWRLLCHGHDYGSGLQGRLHVSGGTVVLRTTEVGVFWLCNESQEYLDNSENLAIYDVNTIANYDPDIIPFLHAPIGSAFERDKLSGLFVKVTG